MSQRATLAHVSVADSLLMLDFKIIKDPQDKLGPFRNVNQDFANSEFLFELNGSIHGKKMFQDPLTFQVTGNRIIKCIEHRIKGLQEVHQQIGQTKYSEEFTSLTV